MSTARKSLCLEAHEPTKEKKKKKKDFRVMTTIVIPNERCMAAIKEFFFIGPFEFSY